MIHHQFPFLHVDVFLGNDDTTRRHDTTTRQHGNSWSCPGPDPIAPRDQIPREGNPSLRSFILWEMGIPKEYHKSWLKCCPRHFVKNATQNKIKKQSSLSSICAGLFFGAYGPILVHMGRWAKSYGIVCSWSQANSPSNASTCLGNLCCPFS